MPFSGPPRTCRVSQARMLRRTRRRSRFHLPEMISCLLCCFVIALECSAVIFAKHKCWARLLRQKHKKGEHYESSEEDFIYACVDVNGLKVVNDTLGHAAGDELLIGAASCLKQSLGNYGKVYRVGGDEFVVMFFADQEKFKFLIEDIVNVTANWSGKLVDSVSISVGYASKYEFPDKTVKEMSLIAEKRMYKEKELYYTNKGIDRRGQNEAYKVLQSLYTKILKINVTKDNFTIIKVDSAEQTANMGYSHKISEWFKGFALSGNVHKDDLDTYLKQTDLAYLKNYFKSNKASLTISYRRKYGDKFKSVEMEIAPANDYKDNNQSLFLYVKKVDK